MRLEYPFFQPVAYAYRYDGMRIEEVIQGMERKLGIQVRSKKAPSSGAFPCFLEVVLVVTVIFPMVYGGHYHDLYPQYRVFSIVLPVVTKDFFARYWYLLELGTIFSAFSARYHGIPRSCHILFVCFPVSFFFGGGDGSY